MVVLFNAFKKKTQKTPDSEIRKALKLKKGLPNVKKNAKKHGKSTMPKSYWMPVKMQGLHKRSLPNV
ncbi:type II toxin-antitoxin system RelE/ParE family toxin [Bacteroides sp. AF34-31BH]|uniref:type II toxin-antitoxin system RelE/ParE family toxin n=1 Tax=Bacteroides sp. AF34-31BH TaxID=2292931 RepID=UPI003977D526